VRITIVWKRWIFFGLLKTDWKNMRIFWSISSSLEKVHSLEEESWLELEDDIFVWGI
jgi:hypothetical protein